MMRHILKILLLLLILSAETIYANEVSQDALDKATNYYEKKDYKEAIKWLKISYDEEPSSEAAFNFGLAYKNLHDYSHAIKWYKKAYEMGEINGGG